MFPTPVFSSVEIVNPTGDPTQIDSSSRLAKVLVLVCHIKAKDEILEKPLNISCTSNVYVPIERLSGILNSALGEPCTKVTSIFSEVLFKIS